MTYIVPKIHIHSSLSALEGQRREASDREVLALSQIFQVPMERLFQPPEE